MHVNARPLYGFWERVGVAGSHDIFHHRVTCDAVAHILGSVETGAIDRDHRHPKAFGGGCADSFDVIANQGWDTGVVNEHGGRGVGLHSLLDGMEQAFFRTTHDNVLLGKVSGQAHSVKRRPGRACAPVIPRTAGTSNRPMDDMGHIDDGEQGNLRPVEGATAGAGPWAGFGATRLGLFIMLASRLVQNFGDLFV